MRQPGPGEGNAGIASTFGSLRDMPRSEADQFLRSLGAEVRTTVRGYVRYKFRDGSEVWIRPDGEDENGALTSAHTTGERVEN